MYKLIIAPQANKELKKLKQEVELSIKALIEDIKEDPRIGKTLDRDLSGKFSYRAGVYRVIYKVNFKDKVINIISAGHRSKVYN